MSISKVNDNTIVSTAKAQFHRVARFIPNDQKQLLGDLLRGEEKIFFAEKILEYIHRVEAMPKNYEQDGLGDKAVAHLHYFHPNGDWYITEKDMESEQHQAFGLATISGNKPELGYISIVELIFTKGLELDLHFEPKTIEAIKEGHKQFVPILIEANAPQTQRKAVFPQ